MSTLIAFPGGGAAAALEVLVIPRLMQTIPQLWSGATTWSGASAGALIAAALATCEPSQIHAITLQLMSDASHLSSGILAAITEPLGLLKYLQAMTVGGPGLFGPMRHASQLIDTLESVVGSKPLRSGASLYVPFISRNGPVIHREPENDPMRRVPALLAGISAPGYFSSQLGWDGGLVDNSGLVVPQLDTRFDTVVTFIIRQWAAPSDATIIHAAASTIAAMLHANTLLGLQIARRRGANVVLIDLRELTAGLELDDFRAARRLLEHPQSAHIASLAVDRAILEASED